LKVIVIAILVASTTALPASADEADARTRARLHFRAGTVFYDAGDYGQAVEQYLAAYKLLPLPDLLFNLGQAYRLKGDAKTAQDYYERYLTAKPSGPVSDEARAHLAEVKAQLEKEQAERLATIDRKQAEGRAAVERKQAEANAATAPTRTMLNREEVEARNHDQPAQSTRGARLSLPASMLSMSAPPRAQRRPLYKKWWLWTVTGVVVGAAASAVAVGVTQGRRREPVLQVYSP
jgi:hypothetical protein